MRAPAPPIDIGPILAQIQAAPGVDRLPQLSADFAQADGQTVEAVLRDAARFCTDYLAPLNQIIDRQGCQLMDGRVRTAPGYAAAWAAYVEGGWPTLEHPVESGGQGLPLYLAAMVQQLLDSSCAAFGMLPVLQRSAARLVAAHASEAIRAEWLPHLVRGDWGASICISEAGAGSDAGRIRTQATLTDQGTWAVNGEKMWISFGDHDLTARIGHFVLARTPKGLSLFLVPRELTTATGTLRRNAVVVRRVEEKMGLHGSPTCALGFEDATGWLIGVEGRGLQQLFVMITNMRLSAGVQGLGIAAAATDIARGYAAERRQGGPANLPAVAIDTHADVQRMLLEMTARVETVRGLALAIAVYADRAALEGEKATRADANALLQWLLPIFKTIGAESGFDVASQAVQVLGGVGYTADWPVEQLLRDARIATIYEGTTGMQALDLLHRRLWRDGGTGLRIFLETARADLTGADELGEQALQCLDLLEQAAARLTQMQPAPRAAEAGATAFLQLAGLAATGWIAARLTRLPTRSAASKRLSAAGRYWLGDLRERAQLAQAQCLRGIDPAELFESL
jgi:alkylation response protein AidB-like acyl-CoA dehydrogenase